tara:strand:+ start:708 stop:1652 length:945 start_codon:yes stop_codon:yes gene_type:complete
MDDYIIEIDSSQRDANIYLDPNDYTLNLNKHVYNVERISLITGKIPTTQPLINRGNKQFQVDNQVIVLPEKNYSNGYVLASDLQTSLTSTNVSTVTYMSNTNTLSFDGGVNKFSFKFHSGSNGFSSSTEYGTPFNVLGFSGIDTPFATTIESGHIDFLGPTNLIIKISTEDEECKKDLYIHDTMNTTYTGRLMMFRDNKTNMLDYKPTDPVEFKFLKGSDKTVSRLRIQWFYNVGNKLIPYDFSGRNHFLKIKIRGSLDKLSVLPRIELPPPIQVEETETVEKQLDIKFYITLFVFILIVIFIWSRRKPVSLVQ